MNLDSRSVAGLESCGDGGEPGVLIVSAAHELTFASEAAARVLGAASSEGLGDLWENGLRAALRESLRRAAEDPVGVATARLPATAGSGAEDLRAEVRRVAVASGAIFVILVREESAPGRAAKNAYLAAKMRVTGRVFGGATHDLFSILNSLVINVELLRQTLDGNLDSDPAVRARQDRSLTNLNDRSLVLSRSLRALIELVRVASEPRGRLDFVELAREAVSFVAAEARQRRVTVDVRLPDSPAPVVGERLRLRDAILCVAVSALDSSIPGGRLEIAMTTSEGLAEITVRAGASATGTPGPVSGMDGFPDEGGSGLLLPVARGILESHGGGLRVEPFEDGVSCLTMAVPLASNPG